MRDLIEDWLIPIAFFFGFIFMILLTIAGIIVVAYLLCSFGAHVWSTFP